MNKRGLTLVEVIISALLLALTVGGVLFIFTTEKGAVTQTGRRVQAMDFVRQTLEQLKNEVGADTWEITDFVNGSYSPDLPSGCELKKFPYQGDPTNSMRDYTISAVPGIPPNSGYKQVTVTVQWTEPEAP